MHSFRNLIARGQLAPRSLSDGSSDHIITLMIALLSIMFFALLLLAFLFMIRRQRQRRQMQADVLPQYNDIKHDVRRTGNHRSLTIQTHNGRSSVLVFNKDGQPMLANPNSPPYSPDNVPEIHITFPEEEDEYGRKQGGRVLLVRVGDNATVGLEPLHDEQLPAYEKESKTQFYSIDMDQIGGLKEKERSDFH